MHFFQKSNNIYNEFFIYHLERELILIGLTIFFLCWAELFGYWLAYTVMKTMLTIEINHVSFQLIRFEH